MTIQIDREHITFNTESGDYVHMAVPDELTQHVDEIMSWAESYRTPQQEATEAVLEAAFDSGELEPETLAVVVKLWIVGEAVVPGNLRSYDGLVYKVVQGHITQNDWKPPDVPALWAVYNKTSEGGEIGLDTGGPYAIRTNGTKVYL